MKRARNRQWINLDNPRKGKPRCGLDFEVAVSIGSSIGDIRERVLRSDGFCANFIVTDSQLIYVHHACNHQVLRDAYALLNSELVASGNCGVVESDRFVVRFRSSYGVGCVGDSVLFKSVEVAMLAFFMKLRGDLHF